MKTNLLLHAWNVKKSNNNYYLPYTHYVYLQEICKYYNHIILISQYEILSNDEINDFLLINKLPVTVHIIGKKKSYFKSLIYFSNYLQCYFKYRNIESIYIRYPVNFGWLSYFYCYNSNRIVHFVGNPFDTFKSFNFFKRLLYNIFYSFEFLFIILSCFKSKLYSNGYIYNKIFKILNFNLRILVSSTLKNDDFYFDNHKALNSGYTNLLYIGYLRKSKNVINILKMFKLLIINQNKSNLKIIGDGDEFLNLNKFSIQNDLNVHFCGHINSREYILKTLRNSDFFCFMSQAEGSPRVILEAMANGLVVLSTRVGYLPFLFEDNINIIFIDFNDYEMMYNKIIYLQNNQKHYNNIRRNAYGRVKNLTINNFIKQIFYNE